MEPPASAVHSLKTTSGSHPALTGITPHLEEFNACTTTELCMATSNGNLTNEDLRRLGAVYLFTYLVTKSIGRHCRANEAVLSIIWEKRPRLLLSFCSIILNSWLPFSNLAPSQNMAGEAPDITFVL